MGRFQGLDKATRGFASNRLREGTYVVRVDECSYFNTEMYGESWKNSLTVLGVIVGDHEVGEEVATTFRQRNKSFNSNLCGFLAGITGANDEDVTEAHAEAALADNSPVKGLVCIVKAVKRTHRTAKNDDGTPVEYFVYTWEQAMSPDQIREAIGEEAVARFFPNGL